jgi:hypothetical protein
MMWRLFNSTLRGKTQSMYVITVENSAVFVKFVLDINVITSCLNLIGLENRAAATTCITFCVTILC